MHLSLADKPRHSRSWNALSVPLLPRTQILRNLLSLMMPKEDDGGPKLVDLIAALVAQQREILVGIKRLQSDMNALFGRLDGKIGAETQSNSVG
jgi:hypothetical protein